MIGRQVVVLAAALAGMAQAAGTPDWRLAAQSDRAISYIDMGSVAKAGASVRFARWMVLAAPLPSGADNIRDTFEADCTTKAYRVLGAETFKQTRSAGRMAGSAGTAEAGTVTASLIDIACGARTATGPAVADPYAAGKARLRPTPAG